MLRFLSRRPTTLAASGARYSILSAPLPEIDPEIFEIIDAEKKRQRESLVLIPSENFTSRSVMEAVGSVMQNKYSEGYPGARYYGGNEYIDRVEMLCQRRALAAFRLEEGKWGVNVQPLSGSPANMYVYSALLNPHDRIMGLDLPHGGHLSHGYQTSSRKVSAVSKFFETFGYQLDKKTGLIDYDKLQELAAVIRPKLLIAGASSYPRLIDYERMRRIADSVGAYLMADISHWSGMMAAGVIPDPFEHADVVTTTTHKSLRGPRAAMIFYRTLRNEGRDADRNLGELINQAVFPGHQGGPHNHTIAAILDNCQALAARLVKQGIKLVSGGSDTHLLLLDLSGREIDGARVERVLELINVAANKNTIPGDKSALKPSGLRIGTPAMTTRGFERGDFEWTADIICEALDITCKIQEQLKSKSIAEFKATVNTESFPMLSSLRRRVIDYVTPFPFIESGTGSR